MEQDGGSGAECGQIGWGGDGGKRRRWGRSDDSDQMAGWMVLPFAVKRLGVNEEVLVMARIKGQ